MGDEYDAWLAAALREGERRIRRRAAAHAGGAADAALAPPQRAARALGHILAALAAEARVEALIDAAACDAWLAAARPSDDRDERGESGPAAAVGLAE